MQKLIIEFSLVKESKEKTSNEIITEISNTLSKDEVLIPWCDKAITVRIDQIET